jgi:sarcosine oxidase subunit gamma
MSESSVMIRRLDDVGYINLRGDPRQTAFIRAAEDALGQALPIEPNTVSAGPHLVCWLGPDEWQIRTSADAVAGLMNGLQKALADQHAASNDLSGGLVTFRVSGADARNLFAKACTLDFHPDVLAVGSCAQSGLAKANVLFVCADDPDTFEIVVRRSFSDYLQRWFKVAGAEFGADRR